MNWLITGGAGYIGSHVADSFLSSGKSLVIIDSLHSGSVDRVSFLEKIHGKKIPFFKLDIRDYLEIAKIIVDFSIGGIVHLAGLKSVSESRIIPEEYFNVNHYATANILEVAKNYEVKKFIFSSSAAVYGESENLGRLTEFEKCNPISPYGESKLLGEKEVNAFSKISGNSGTSLRYFNVIGTKYPELDDGRGENLVPIVKKLLCAGSRPQVFGNDYLTPDGTCIRDYVDVRDIAVAHLLLANNTGETPLTLNLGTGQGSSVIEVITQIGKEMGLKDVPIEFQPRRPGDPPIVCADPELARRMIGYSTHYSFSQSIASLFVKKSM